MKIFYTLILIVLTSLGTAAQCDKVISSVEDPGPAQVTGSTLPVDAKEMDWFFPADYTRLVAFGGSVGSKASHEGVDYVHENKEQPHVYVHSIGAGEVVYVREGCPESSLFAHNNYSRECGAGWGNHVVIKHGSIYSRYAHLRKGTVQVKVGDVVFGEQLIGEMGNSGRSELRHLHFEVGTRTQLFDPCGMSQNFDYVYNPSQLNYKKRTGIDDELAEDTAKVVVYHERNAEHITVEMPAMHKLGQVKCIELYDALGRKLYEVVVSGCNANSVYRLPFLARQQPLICRIVTTKLSFTRKFMS
ncbi:M23 family metallopeptidase [Carboxylicivirga mesophila]|uniref:M23 family metallopeptidase n=1 Tax=Carboxylicivirga mesophila TaxID=1166478 RepID=A0ABS5KAD1_9BACT|nr:M23 family metallopeptidase [Carboxylicivirga mesophila]MBS2211924.1 M23 family metallopeptidase [Carboxylicivirga mesophila]